MKYEGVSDELLERIARDVRAWDKAQSPEVRQQRAVQKIAESLDVKYDKERAERDTVAAEIQALAAVFSAGTGQATLLSAPAVKALVYRYGLGSMLG